MLLKKNLRAVNVPRNMSMTTLDTVLGDDCGVDRVSILKDGCGALSKTTHPSIAPRTYISRLHLIAEK